MAHQSLQVAAVAAYSIGCDIAHQSLQVASVAAVAAVAAVASVAPGASIATRHSIKIYFSFIGKVIFILG